MARRTRQYGEQNGSTRRGSGERASARDRVAFGAMQFVDVRLTQTETEAYDQNRLTEEEQLDALQELVFEGYKVSVVRDVDHDCFICSLSMNDPDHDNGGYVLVTRGADVRDALGLTLYKHYTILVRDWLGAQVVAGMHMRG